MTMVSVSGPKVQEAIDIRDQILAVDNKFLGLLGLLLNDPQFVHVSSERRAQEVHKLHKEAELKRDALIELGKRRGVL